MVVNKDHLLKREADFHSYPVFDEYFQAVPFYSKLVNNNENLTRFFEGEYVHVIAKSEKKFKNGYWYYIKLPEFNYDGVEGWIHGNDDDLLMGTDERWTYEEKIKEKIKVLIKEDEQVQNEYAASLIKEKLEPVVSELNKTINANYKINVQKGGYRTIEWEENEKQLLSKHKDIVSKNDDELIFTLKNGKTVTFKSLYNPPVETDYKVYTLTKIDIEREFAVIAVSYYEWANGIILNLNDGSQLGTSDFEVFDTVKNDFVVSFNIMSERSNGKFKINIIKIKNGNASLVKTLEGEDLIYTSDNGYFLSGADFDKDVVNFYFQSTRVNY